jgi:hypothetical protein
MVRCASYVRSSWVTDVQVSRKLLVGGVNTIISSVTKSECIQCANGSGCSLLGKIKVRSSWIHLRRVRNPCLRHIPTNSDAKSALLAIGMGEHVTVQCLVRSIITVALGITISAHRDAISIVVAKEFVFCAFR